jgi:hypothetical protein
VLELWALGLCSLRGALAKTPVLTTNRGLRDSNRDWHSRLTDATVTASGVPDSDTWVPGLAFPDRGRVV